MEMNIISILELSIGLIVFWFSAYLVFRDPTSRLSWLIAIFLCGCGLTLLITPVLNGSPTFKEYIFWQKITDWPLFFMPVLIFNISSLVSNKHKDKVYKLIIVGYILASIFWMLDVRGGYILRENVLRFDDFRRMDGFAPGIMMLPFVIYALVYFLLSSILFIMNLKINFLRNVLGLSCLVLAFVAIVAGLSYYYIVPFSVDNLFSILVGIAIMMFSYTIIKYHLFIPREKNIFDKTFFYKTTYVFLLAISLIILFRVSGLIFTHEALVFFVLFIPVLIVSLALYEWVLTYINDLVYNPSKGFSIVNDEEVYGVLKNFNQPERLESSSLMRLKLINNKLRDNKSLTPVDALQELVREVTDHFAPKKEEKRRIKQNLKHHLISMMTYDEAEEGQILWELGFEYYPVKIMAQERKYRSPLFEAESPADYTYTSRNAFLALKKEAIHDITWRISYLEKNIK